MGDPLSNTTDLVVSLLTEALLPFDQAGFPSVGCLLPWAENRAVSRVSCQDTSPFLFICGKVVIPNLDFGIGSNKYKK